MAKFKKGDTIGATELGKGLEKAVVLGTFTGAKGRSKGKQFYQLKIIKGTATVPVSAEVNYQLIKEKK